MKKNLLVGGLAALALVTAGGVALAQQQDRPQRMQGADTDRDGRLSQAEFVGGRVERLTRADADRNGAVTAEERSAMRQARTSQRADARFGRLDTDGNGAISQAEFDAMREARAERGQGTDRKHGPARLETAAARRNARGPVVIAEAQAKAEQAFARLDSDGDGYVTTAERQAARGTMREQRQERVMQRRAARQASPTTPASE